MKYRTYKRIQLNQNIADFMEWGLDMSPAERRYQLWIMANKILAHIFIPLAEILVEALTPLSEIWDDIFKEKPKIKSKKFETMISISEDEHDQMAIDTYTYLLNITPFWRLRKRRKLKKLIEKHRIELVKHEIEKWMYCGTCGFPSDRVGYFNEIGNTVRICPECKKKMDKLIKNG